MDAMVDWANGSNHYDSRVVRSCRPGFSESTDPEVDGRWSEPAGTFGGVTGMQKGWAYMIDDSSLVVVNYPGENFTDAGTGGYESPAPGTGTQGYARVRTRYNNGTVLSCNPLPANVAAGSGGCS